MSESEEENVWQNAVKSFASTENLKSFYDSFFSSFDQSWNEHVSNYKFDELAQLARGNRLRPMLVYWGFLLTKTDKSIFQGNNSELRYIVGFCVAIESIHKTSLLLDDLIDHDDHRHGKPTFHVLHGSSSTILTAVNVMLKGIVDLQHYLDAGHFSESVIKRSINILLNTALEMSSGALQEVRLNDSVDADIQTIKRIVQLETGTIIKQGLLLGYNAGDGNNKRVEQLLEEIGHACGYIFQALNDLEPFGNKDGIKNHKGKLSLDILENRKNIVIAYIRVIAGTKEMELLKQIKDPIQIHSRVNNLILKHNISEILFEEIDVLQEKIANAVDEIQRLTTSNLWGQHFKHFVAILIKVSKKRALQ